jgi:hypothetical protein
VGATRVRSNVAADLRLLGGTGIGREQDPAFANDSPELRRAQAGLDLDAPEERLERAHLNKALEREHDSSVDRHGTAREARPASARHNRDVVVVAPCDGSRDLGGRSRQRDCVGSTLHSATFGCVRQVLGGGLGEHGAGAENGS